jgi:protein subunit release factor A
MVDKLRAAECTFKELQLRMADPDVANNSQEFQKVSSRCDKGHAASAVDHGASAGQVGQFQLVQL